MRLRSLRGSTGTAHLEGKPVESCDGMVLGTVAELTPTHFRVDVRAARDFWLSRSVISSVEPERIVLSFAADQVKDFQARSPSVPADNPVLAEQLDAFADPADQEAKRRAMERGPVAEDEAGQIQLHEPFAHEPAYRRPGSGGSGAPD